MTQALKLALLETNIILRKGIEGLVQDYRSATLDLNTFADHESLERYLSQQMIDVLLLDDAGLGCARLTEMIADWRQRFPSMRIAVLSDRLTFAHIDRVCRSGGSAFIYKAELDRHLVNVVELLRRDMFALSPRAVEIHMSWHFLQQLNQQDREVLQLLTEGSDIADIALRLHFSERSVYRSRAKIREVLNVRTNEMIIEEARKHGLLDDGC